MKRKNNKYQVGGNNPLSFKEWYSQMYNEQQPYMMATTNYTDLMNDYVNYLSSFNNNAIYNTALTNGVPTQLNNSNPQSNNSFTFGKTIDFGGGRSTMGINDPETLGYELNSDGKYRKAVTTKDNNNLGYSDFFKALNPLLDTSRFLAGSFGELNNQKEEREKLLRYRYNKNDIGYNTHPQGINNIPAYFQNGGKYVPKQRDGVRQNNDGTYSTHKMAYVEANGKYYAYPTVFQNEDGTWVELDDSQDFAAFKEAQKRNEVYEFNTEKEAADFAKGSWKNNKQFQEGGELPPLTEQQIKDNEWYKQEYGVDAPRLPNGQLDFRKPDSLPSYENYYSTRYLGKWREKPVVVVEDNTDVITPSTTDANTYLSVS